jgi:N-acetylglucosamine malate deacetylase 1
MAKRILILAPHTDDGELGCGGTIAKYIEEGDEVFYLAFSSCRRSLPAGWEEDTLVKEVKAATTVLGIPASNLIILDYDVRVFKDKRQEILEDLWKIKRQVAPDIIYLPSPSDLHQDHQTIFEEGLRAFKTNTIISYELPWNNITFKTSGFMALEERHLLKKAEALKAYKSQEHRQYTNDDFLYSLAKVRGVQIGVKYAEAFEIIRIML